MITPPDPDRDRISPTASDRRQPPRRQAAQVRTPEPVYEHPSGRAPGRASERTASDRLRRRPLLSPLTRRILAVNLIAPLLLLVGVLYLDEYEQGLLNAETEALRVQGELIAAAVGEGAVLAELTELETSSLPITHHTLKKEQAQSMVRRLSELAGIRVRLFDTNGLLVADSRRLIGPGGAVQVEDLGPLAEPTLMTQLKETYDWAMRGLHHPVLPRYVERLDQAAGDYAEVASALDFGVPATALRRLNADHRLLSAAVPVSYYKQVVGAIMVSRPDDSIAQSLFQVRTTILQLFVGTLVVTTLLSIYLARAIARPVSLLALAAIRVRQRRGQQTTIPDLSYRKDEIGDLSTSLRDMTEALWQRMDAIERFAADVAHEIKNPLTSIRSAVETVTRLKDPEKQQRLLGIIQDDVGRLDRLISDISDASRLDAELSRSEADDVDLRPLLETLADIYATTGVTADTDPDADSDADPDEEGNRPEDRNPGKQAASGPLVLRLPDDDRPLVVRGMADRLVQVLRNLIGNAISFSPAPGSITLRARCTPEHLVLTVEDRGPGLPPGKEEAIFDRFYSERPSTEKFGAHSGLGLSISRQIIESHGGSIRAANRHGDQGTIIGACFTVTLPLLSPRRASAKAGSRTASRTLSRGEEPYSTGD